MFHSTLPLERVVATEGGICVILDFGVPLAKGEKSFLSTHIDTSTHTLLYAAKNTEFNGEFVYHIK